MEPELFNVLLEYLRNQIKTKKIESKEEPVKIPKGLQADKYVFTLNNAPEHISKPLLVRIFRKTSRSGYAKGEAQVQNALHNIGYPVPRVFFACSDKSVIGREFTVMEYKNGINLSETERPDIPEIIGRLHTKLHSIDPSTLMKTITPEDGGTIRYSITEYLDEYIRKNNYTRLFPALEWVLDNRPRYEPSVLCHGDFHAENILWDNDSVSAVLDWGAFRFEEPAFDVAYIIVKLRAFYPPQLHGVSLNVYIDRYFRSYNERRKIGRDKFSYFEAVGALNALNEIETHLIDFTAPSFKRMLEEVDGYMINLFEEHSGVIIPSIPSDEI